MKTKKPIQITSTILILGGIILIISFDRGITGAALGAYSGPILPGLIGLVAMFSGLFLFATGGLESKLDKNINSFRRWLEKQEGHKVPYQKAEELYQEIKSDYNKAMGKGRIGREGIKSIRRLEDYAKQHADEYGIEIKKKRERYTNLADQMLNQGKMPDKTKQLIKIAKGIEGYRVDESHDHAIVYDKKGRKITEIPKHSKTIKKGTVKNILKSLAKEEPYRGIKRSA